MNGALFLVLAAAVIVAVALLIPVRLDRRTARLREEHERARAERMRRLHSQHPLSMRYGGDRFDVF